MEEGFGCGVFEVLAMPTLREFLDAADGLAVEKTEDVVEDLFFSTFLWSKLRGESEADARKHVAERWKDARFDEMKERAIRRVYFGEEAK